MLKKGKKGDHKDPKESGSWNAPQNRPERKNEQRKGKEQQKQASVGGNEPILTKKDDSGVVPMPQATAQSDGRGKQHQLPKKSEWSDIVKDNQEQGTSSTIQGAFDIQQNVADVDENNPWQVQRSSRFKKKTTRSDGSGKQDQLPKKSEWRDIVKDNQEQGTSSTIQGAFDIQQNVADVDGNNPWQVQRSSRFKQKTTRSDGSGKQDQLPKKSEWRDIVKDNQEQGTSSTIQGAFDIQQNVADVDGNNPWQVQRSSRFKQKPQNKFEHKEFPSLKELKKELPPAPEVERRLVPKQNDSLKYLQQQKLPQWTTGCGQKQKPELKEKFIEKSLSPSKRQIACTNKELVPQFKEFSCSGIRRGTFGIQGIVETNYMKVDLTDMKNVLYHYDVTITPNQPKKLLHHVFDQCRHENFKEIGMAFDGSKSCYTVHRLPKNYYNFDVSIPTPNMAFKEFNIQIKETETIEIDMNSLRTYHRDRVFDKPMRALQALEIILAYTYHKKGVRVGRSFYSKPSITYNLRDGYEMYTGIYQAAILGEQPLLNVDISHKSFPKGQMVLEYLREIGVRNFRTKLPQELFDKAFAYLEGMVIAYIPPICFGAVTRNYKVIGLNDSSNALTFYSMSGEYVSVLQHFKTRGYNLLYPFLNCIQVRCGENTIAFPMELCAILDYQSIIRKDGTMTQLVRHAATSTTNRKNKIMNLLNIFQARESLTLQQLGVRLGNNFIRVHMRLLPPPVLEYRGGLVTPRRGSWQINSNCTLLKTPDYVRWGIIYHKSAKFHYNVVYDLHKHLYKVAQHLNVNLSETCPIEDFYSIEEALSGMSKLKLDLVIVVITTDVKYAEVKQLAELKYGLLTQCIKATSIPRFMRDTSISHNLILKINTKLNGINHKIAAERDKKIADLMLPIANVMFMGADVTHPSPEQNNIPSVVGAAATYDVHGTCYSMQYRLQRPKLEEIEDMEDIATYHLNCYLQHQRRFPSAIIYYRDGVSDGQFPTIRAVELSGIQRACKKLKCDAKLVCLIVVKRHHTRFFPTTVSPTDKYNNVEPGTVVDQTIVHPNEVQFFLVSHQVIQGTARPTRYNVLLNEPNFHVDLLQKLTYNLCHLFPRCNRSISYPAPAYLAHLIAFRGRIYLEGCESSPNLREEYNKRLSRCDIIKKTPMYFI